MRYGNIGPAVSHQTASVSQAAGVQAGLTADGLGLGSGNGRPAGLVVLLGFNRFLTVWAIPQSQRSLGLLNLASAIAGLAVCCVGKADLRQPGEPFALSQRTRHFMTVTGRLGAGSCEER